MLDEFRDQVLHRNTWGDALYVVLTDPVAAAACALELQEAMAAIDLEAAGLPGPPRASAGSARRPGLPDRATR